MSASRNVGGMQSGSGKETCEALAERVSVWLERGQLSLMFPTIK
ncbi:hypothetical protein [Nafulsella turpanensis]|nr:hypothetical protein [Nafulsella turpanensis]